MIINEMHRVVLKDFASGDYAYLCEQEEITDDQLEEIGDHLLRFMLVELSDENDCEDLDEGIARLENGKDDLVIALHVLQLLKEAKSELMKLVG